LHGKVKLSRCSIKHQLWPTQNVTGLDKCDKAAEWSWIIILWMSARTFTSKLVRSACVRRSERGTASKLLDDLTCRNHLERFVVNGSDGTAVGKQQLLLSQAPASLLVGRIYFRLFFDKRKRCKWRRSEKRQALVRSGSNSEEQHPARDFCFGRDS